MQTVFTWQGLEAGRRLEASFLLTLGIPLNIMDAGFGTVAHGVGAVGRGVFRENLSLPIRSRTLMDTWTYRQEIIRTFV